VEVHLGVAWRILLLPEAVQVGHLLAKEEDLKDQKEYQN